MPNDIKAIDGEIITPSHDVAPLQRGDRTRFAELLSVFVGPEVAPTPEALQKWSNKFPDRWMYSVKLLAGLVGFSEKVELSGSLAHEIARLPDAELMKRLEDMERGPKVSRTEAVPAGDAGEAAGK